MATTGSSHQLNTRSRAMRFFDECKLESVAWALRRLHVPVDKRALVLEVGSGGNPYPRSNVLLDGYEASLERTPWDADLIRDRPMVLGLIECLPFKNKSFDFIIASHVLEHSPDPKSFLEELMRVGKAGYIETPDAFFERINPFRYHRLEVTETSGQLQIWKKSNWRPHIEWVSMYEQKLKDSTFIKYILRHPKPFYTRFYWQDCIAFKIENNEVDASWPIPLVTNKKSLRPRRSTMLRRRFVRLARHLFSQNDRNKEISIFDLIQCPLCRKETQLTKTESFVRCEICRSSFPFVNGLLQIFPPGVATQQRVVLSH